MARASCPCHNESMVLELRQVLGRVSFERVFAAVAAEEDDLAGDDDARRCSHRAERLVRHRADLLALGKQPILRRELLKRGRCGGIRFGWSPAIAASEQPLRSPRPAPK